jgi:hypothetical protein
MSKRTTQRIITALTATLLLATAVSTASARIFSTSNQGIRATWTSLEFNGGLVIRCQVTLEGSFHSRTIVKVARLLIGAITNARFKQETCTGGRFSTFNGTERYNGGTPSNTLPWHLTYESFIGNLPTIAGIRILLSRFRFGEEIPGTCTGRIGSATDNITALAARNTVNGEITSITPVEGLNRATIITRDAGIFCPTTLEFRGTGQLTLLNSAAKITITLI